MTVDLRVGDVVSVSCPYTPARVIRKTLEHVVLKWPWWSADPDCDWVEWNGDVALVGDPASHAWDKELFRTDPAAEQLTAGAVCRVGIPASLVHVVAVDHFDPPLETGRLPRPGRRVVVLRAGRSLDPESEEQGYGICPDAGIPIGFELVFRPYACLVAGDEVADAAGRAWRFDGPWDWHPFDGDEPHEPRWPLALLTRGGSADEAGAAAVAAATKDGSHQGEVARWVELARARPTHGVTGQREFRATSVALRRGPGRSSRGPARRAMPGDR
ncbi:hypothetical protein [Streptomyces sp. Tue6028]|uniref:hypothetical protein n=1 Tax=Streptomyces sp. Tue6028 TaxID=2036037 RepID=UPI003D7405FE